MWLKWIRCSIKEENREAFCASQQQWSAIRGQVGLLGQFGGWGLDDPKQVGIIGLWENEKSLQAFMAPGGAHDRIYAANGQQDLLLSCQTQVFHELFPMSGELPSLRAAAREATFMRVAHFRVSSADYPQLLRAQRDIWMPAMRTTPGMLGGSFGSDGSDGFLVVSLWQCQGDHDTYRQDFLPDLRREVTAMGGFPDSISGYLLNLEPRWNIL